MTSSERGRRTYRSDDCVGGTVPARAEAVPLLRREIVGLAAANGAREDLLARIALAVSEAVTNAVRHAYPGTVAGVVEYAADVEDGDLQIVIGDHGTGIRDDPAPDGLGLGLGLIAASADDLRIEDRELEGLTVWMRFVLDGP